MLGIQDSGSQSIHSAVNPIRSCRGSIRKDLPRRLAPCMRTTNRAPSPSVMGEDQDGGVEGTVVWKALLITAFLKATRAAMKPASVSCGLRLSSTTGDAGLLIQAVSDNRGPIPHAGRCRQPAPDHGGHCSFHHQAFRNALGRPVEGGGPKCRFHCPSAFLGQRLGPRHLRERNASRVRHALRQFG